MTCTTFNISSSRSACGSLKCHCLYTHISCECGSVCFFVFYFQVLWRYTGDKPDTLGENTKIYEWIPQNDLLGLCYNLWLCIDFILIKIKQQLEDLMLNCFLTFTANYLNNTTFSLMAQSFEWNSSAPYWGLLPFAKLHNLLCLSPGSGHPKTRAFITHGGTNGIYEAIYHAVPMVGIPLFGDQPDNLAHMKAKGAAFVMDLNSMQIQDLVEGLDAVINNPSWVDCHCATMTRLQCRYFEEPMLVLLLILNIDKIDRWTVYKV